ncbi:MAG: hypothetical protein Q8R28_23295 [Dehalococcoidia bacterium]|nr:hypothetical protein [Dehalococcoidia bacterium]
MSEKITLVFNTDGTMEISDEPGENAEKTMKRLGILMGPIERRGHAHGAHSHEGVKLEQQ